METAKMTLTAAPVNQGDVILGVRRAACDAGVAVSPNNRTAFRAYTINTAVDLCLPSGTDIILAATRTIGFAPGFYVKSGARLRAGVGP
jgi:hypothetical protein